MNSQNNKNVGVILVHGFWSKPWSLYYWKRFLQHQGLNVYDFGYRSSGRPFAYNVQQMIHFTNSRAESIIHIIAHSMGGLLSVTALPKIIKNGRLVMLGSPINGSSLAKMLKRINLHQFTTRHASRILTEGLNNPKINRKSLMIAGNKSIGIGQIWKNLEKPNDGTVSLKETQADWVNAHHTIPTHHMGLLNNNTAQNLALQFIMQQTESPQMRYLHNE